MFSCVHQRNIRITAAPSNLTNYAKRTLCTKTPLSRGMTGKTFTDTEKKRKKKKHRRNITHFPSGIAIYDSHSLSRIVLFNNNLINVLPVLPAGVVGGGGGELPVGKSTL